MARHILAFLAALVAAAAVIGGIEFAAHVVYAPATPLDRNDPAAVAAFVASMPVGAFIAVLVAYVAGTFTGGWVGGRIARSRQRVHAAAIAALVLAGALVNILAIAHPLWFTVAVLLLVPAAALAAARLAGAGAPRA